MGEHALTWADGVATVLLDGFPQSAVDPADPLRLDFEYVQHLAMALDAATAPGPLRVTHIGGGGLTLARWVAATRPGSSQIVLEPDAALTNLVRRELPLPRGERIRVRPVDGRAGLAGLRDASADVVVLDAYAQGRVPSELVTLEAMAEVARVLAPGGVLLANLADEPGLRWIARVAATVTARIGECAGVGLHEVLKGKRFGNLVLVAASDGSPLTELHRRAASQPLPTGILTGAQLRQRVPGATPFTDATSEPSPPPPEPGSWRRR